MDNAPQQINLYNPALRRQRVWLSLSNVAMAAGLFAVILFAFGFALHSQASAKRVAAEALETRLVAMRAEMMQLSGELAANASSDAASRELTDLKQQVTARTEVLSALRAGAGLEPLRGQATLGFADYLRGLARQTVDGLWLTGFVVGQGGSGLEVRGRMLVVDRLPEYIKRLNAEPTFKGRQFISLNIARADKPAGQSQGTAFSSFVLTAMPEAKDTEKPGAKETAADKAPTGANSKEANK